MFLSALFSLPDDVYLADVCLEHETLTLVLKASQTSAACSAYMHPSTRIRSKYTRTLADLLCQGRAVRVRLEVLRFVYATRGCPRTTFAKANEPKRYVICRSATHMYNDGSVCYHLRDQ
jgi:transposase